MEPLPPITIRMLWAALASLVISQLTPPAVANALALWPLHLAGPASFVDAVGAFRPWQLLTHMLLNGVLDLLFVALTLFYFAAQLERWWGRRRFLGFLAWCGLGAAVLQLLVSSVALALGWTQETASAGADGLMYAILFAVAYLDPRREVRLLLPPIEMKMRTMVIVFTVIALVFGIQARGVWGVAGFVGAMGIAWLHIRYWRGQPPFSKKKPPPKPRHLRSVN